LIASERQISKVGDKNSKNRMTRFEKGRGYEIKRRRFQGRRVENFKNFRRSNRWKRVEGGAIKWRIWYDKGWRKTTKRILRILEEKK